MRLQKPKLRPAPSAACFTPERLRRIERNNYMQGKMRIGRRELIVGTAALALAPVSRARAGLVLGEGSLFTEPWFLQSFLLLREDVAAAQKEGKRYAIMWELRGCPYCKETHLVNFAQARIADYIKSNFEVLQLNILGSRQVTDLDGEVLAEKDLARKYDVR